MPDWQERITRDTKPSIRVEHDLRYAAAAPIVRGTPAWADLGCGAGVAAADALGPDALGRVVLVDADADALDQAGRDLQAREVVRVHADLATDAGVAQVREALAAGTPGVVTCFEVIEHLETFVPLAEALIGLGEAGWTVVLSVPNDAFWALENPYHHTMWGEGAFEELRRLLPADAVVARQVPLDGSHLVLESFDGELEVPPVRPRADAVPSHFIAAFGPRARELGARSSVAQADLSSAEGLAAVRAALGDARDGVVSCFEVIEHLESFVGVIELLVELATERDFTIVLSVPNDAFWPIESPWHKTMWGEGSFEELRRLLPADHVVIQQVPLQGSALIPEGADAATPGAFTARGDGVPSHFIAAFGPRAPEVGARSDVAQADLAEQRRWERQREANLAIYEDHITWADRQLAQRQG